MIHTIRRWAGVVVVGVILAGCAGSAPYTLGPIKTVDPDTTAIPRPAEEPEYMYWDRIDLSVFHQLQKPLNLNWVGQKLGVASSDEADNVNVLDEPPNSSWYTHRHFYRPMTPRELAVGPNVRDTTGVAAGPDTSRAWTVVSGKFEGASRGFVIKDARGDRYVMKLDGPTYPELTSSAEVISTKILHAAGYYVPQNTVTYFRLDQLVVGDEAEVRVRGGRRPMRRSDLEEMLSDYERRPDGTIRALASKYVDGRPLGPFGFKGRRDGDPNDRVRHEQRRELRGLSVVSAWLHDTDRRAANTLCVYTDAGYIKHYIFDMGSTLGANASSIHRPVQGQAYAIDQRKIPQALLAFGAFDFPWWTFDPTPPYPSVGYYRADVFDPAVWVPTYPNPAFEKATRRDSYWGAKLVMSFSDADLEAIVATGQLSNPNAEAYLLSVLKARRDKIGRYWFARVAPLDRFQIHTGGELAARDGGTAGPLQLRFDDLAVTGALVPEGESEYAYRLFADGDPLGPERRTRASEIPLRTASSTLARALDARGATEPDDRVVRVDLRVVRPAGADSPPPMRVWVHVPREGAPRVVGIER